MIRRELVAAIAIVSGVMVAATTAPAQTTDSTITGSSREQGFLPAIVFRPLIADPAEPQLGTALRSGDFSQRGSLEGIATFGASLPILGFVSANKKTAVQVGAAGGMIARFDMHTRANDIVSEDYEIGFPVWMRSGIFGARFRVYHRSSHIGDEFVLNNPGFTRFDMTYEAVEGVTGVTFGGARVYIGGDYIYHNATTRIAPGTLRIGGDLISASGFDSGSLHGRWVAGLDVKASRDLDWRAAKSAVTGFELSRAGSSSPAMRIMIELSSGPSTAGQFYGKSEKYVGLAAYITP